MSIIGYMGAERLIGSVLSSNELRNGIVLQKGESGIRSIGSVMDISSIRNTVTFANAAKKSTSLLDEPRHVFVPESVRPLGEGNQEWITRLENVGFARKTSQRIG